MVVLRNNKTTDIKKIYFSNKIDIQYYFLSKTEKKDKKKVNKKIIKNNNIIINNIIDKKIKNKYIWKQLFH